MDYAPWIATSKAVMCSKQNGAASIDRTKNISHIGYRKMKRKLSAAMTLLATLLVAQGAHAGLNGDSITGSLSANPDAWGQVPQQFSPTAVVGAGTEFTGQYAFAPGGSVSELWRVAVDVADTTFAISVTSVSGYDNIYAYSNTLFSIHLGDLNFGTPITGVTLTSGLAAVEGDTAIKVFATSTTANSVDISFMNLPSSLHGAGNWSFAIQPAPVPEPATYGMMLAGLGLAGFAARRRKSGRA